MSGPQRVFALIDCNSFYCSCERICQPALKRRPVVALSISDPTDPYRYLIIKGPVVDETEDGGYDRICDLNLKYKGVRNYPKIPGQVRVNYRVKPESIYPVN